jgi:SAM-dependent methyltransferase
MPARDKYLLGYKPAEAARLRAQARLWDPVSHRLFDRVGVKPGWKVLEIGPGQGSLHMELRRRVRGPIDAVERSPLFSQTLTALAKRDGYGVGRIFQTDLIDANLPRSTYDLIFARWVFLFLPDPAAHIRNLARALKPGGRLAIQDYHRDTLMLVPRPADWAEFMLADRAFFASAGGNVSVGPLLPDLYRRAGLRLSDIELTMKTGHPRSATWKWLTTFFMEILDRYAAFAPFSSEKAARVRRAWRAAERNRASLLIGPALLDVVGVKPRSSVRR